MGAGGGGAGVGGLAVERVGAAEGPVAEHEGRAVAADVEPQHAAGEAEEHFKEAAEAYGVLGDPEKRRRYDTYGHAGLGGPAGGQGDFGDLGGFSDLFNDLYPTCKALSGLKQKLTLEGSLGGKHSDDLGF